MAPRCTVCSHPDRDKIDRRLVGGESARGIAREFGLSHAAADRHRARHIPHELAQAHQAVEVARAGSLLDEIRGHAARAGRLVDQAEAVLSGARGRRQLRVRLEAIKTATVALREVRGTLELLGKVGGELGTGGITVAIQAAPEWQALRDRILCALRPHPDALRAVVEALGGAPAPGILEG